MLMTLNEIRVQRTLVIPVVGRKLRFDRSLETTDRTPLWSTKQPLMEWEDHQTPETTVR